MDTTLNSSYNIKVSAIIKFIMINKLDSINDWIGLKAYQSSGGFVNNTFARLALWRARRAYPEGKQAFSVPDDVYNILDKPHSEELVDDIKEAVEKGLNSEAAMEREVGGKISQRFVSSRDFDFQEHIDFSRVFTDEVKEMIESHFGSYFAVDEAKAYRSFPIATDDIEDLANTTYNWHIGGHSPVTLKMFVLLTDVTEEDGPTEISRSAITSFSSDDRDIYTYTDVAPDNVEKLTGSKGTTYLFAHEQKLHRAGIVQEGRSRDVIYFRLVPSLKPLSENWTDESPYTDYHAKRSTTGTGQFFKM